MVLREPLDALALIVEMGGAKRPRREPAGTMWVVADHTLASKQDWPNRPRHEGQPVHWWRGSVIMSGFARKRVAQTWTVQSDGRTFKPPIDDYCDNNGRRSRRL